MFSNKLTSIERRLRSTSVIYSPLLISCDSGEVFHQFPASVFHAYGTCDSQVERDIQKVSEAYETLSRHSQKKENLEKLMRLKLESEINCVNETNQQLQGKYGTVYSS